jgi:hypothetical protein
MRRKQRAGLWVAVCVVLAVLALALRLIGNVSDLWDWIERISWVAGTASLAAAVVSLRARPEPGVRATGVSAQQRAVILRRVRHKWITGVLEPSLANAARLALGLQRTTELINLGERAVRRAGGPVVPVPAETSISTLFDESGSSLLIVGAPGTGKTTALLELCEVLLDRAGNSAERPIPVVLNLSSWARQRQPVEDWIAEELTLAYQVPHRMATDMVRNGELALLLDGLDEVAPIHRDACVKAINVWRTDHGLIPVAVCSRKAEARALESRLLLDEAVELLPPSDTQIDHYLEKLHSSGTPVGDFRAAIQADGELAQLLRSPLMLHVITLAYHGRDPEGLNQPGTVLERQNRLWTAYISRMFEQRPLERAIGYNKQQALTWLRALARSLEAQNQTEFHLDRLSASSVLDPSRRRRALLLTTASGGPIAGAVAGVTFALINSAYHVNLGMRAAILGGIYTGLGCAALGALLIGLSGGLVTNTPTQERITWSWRRLGIRATTRLNDFGIAALEPALLFGVCAAVVAAAIGGVIAGPAVAVFAGLAAGQGCAWSWAMLGVVASKRFSVHVAPTEQLAWSWKKLRNGAVTAVVGGLIGGAICGLGVYVAAPEFAVVGLVTGVTGLTAAGLFLSGLSPTLRDERSAPNEGIRRSARYALTTGVPIAVIVGVLCAASGVLAPEPPNYLLAGLGCGLPFGAAAALIFGGGACVRHYLIRAWLTGEGNAPWRYAAFLSEMTERLLLRRSGSAFLFVHRLLREHLAADQPPIGRTPLDDRPTADFGSAGHS